MRHVLDEAGYSEVKTPLMMDRVLWEKSGHWENYRENMFTTESEKRDYAVKPMNCPGHVQIFNAALHSYRDLPLRWRVRIMPSQRALRRAPRPDARARFRAGRCTHFLYRSADQSEVTAFNELLLRVYRRLRLQ
jgi:threonyl-tRNA synthetase